LAQIARDLQAGGLKVNGNLSTVGNMNVTGNLNVNGAINFLPKGVIVAWNGTSAPAGWAVCDGQNGTPDLRGRFVLAQGQGNGLTNRQLNQTGGVESVTLTVEQIPPHNHHWLARNDDYNGVGGGNTSLEDDAGPERPIQTSSTGGGNPHENMPPFYVLTYIMKL